MEKIIFLAFVTTAFGYPTTKDTITPRGLMVFVPDDEGVKTTKTFGFLGIGPYQMPFLGANFGYGGGHPYPGENSNQAGNTYPGINTYQGGSAYTGSAAYPGGNVYSVGNTYPGTNSYQGWNLYPGNDAQFGGVQASGYNANLGVPPGVLGSQPFGVGSTLVTAGIRPGWKGDSKPGWRA